MTRKDYLTIAASLKTTKPSGPDIAVNCWKIMVAHLASELKQDNPRFDKDRFFKYCGYSYKK